MNAFEQWFEALDRHDKWLIKDALRETWNAAMERVVKVVIEIDDLSRKGMIVTSEVIVKAIEKEKV